MGLGDGSGEGEATGEAVAGAAGVGETACELEVAHPHDIATTRAHAANLITQ
jgi:hypothetical protein